MGRFMGCLAAALIATTTATVALPASARHNAVSDPWSGGFDQTSRFGSDDPAATAIAISQVRFADGQAAHVVLTRDDDFPDALAGTPLLGEGPMLLTDRAQLDPAVLDEVARAVPAGGTVYLLGGTAALSQDIEDQLVADGFDVRRLWGPGRVETAVAIAQEVTRLYPESAGQILIARARGTVTNPTAGFADSVTGGGHAANAHVAVVLSDTDGLSEQTADYLKLEAREEATLLGGEAALSAQVLADVRAVVGSATRVAGAGRDATAVAISTDLWNRPEGSGRYLVTNGYTANAYLFGLPAAGLAADFDAPLLVAGTDVVPAATLAAVSANDVKSVRTLVLGGTATLNDDVVTAIESRDGCAGCTSNPAAPPIGDGTLLLGVVTPDRGTDVDVSRDVGIRMALDDIVAAGGIPGLEVRTVTERIDGTPGQANEAVGRLIGDHGVEAVIGPHSTAAGLAVIDLLIDAGVPACSMSSTGSVFTDYEEAPGFYFRTALPDGLQAAAMLKVAASMGHHSVSTIVADPHHDWGMSDDLNDAAPDHGITVVSSQHDDGDGSWADEVAAAVGSSADAHLVVAFGADARGIVDELLAAGVSPSDIIGYEGVANDVRRPDTDGMTTLQQDETGTVEFSSGFGTRTPGTMERFAAHAYDCTIIAVLAAASAGTDDSPAIAAAMADVTRGGSRCTTVADCLQAAVDGADVDYDGASGPGEWTDAGEPSLGSYLVCTMTDGAPVCDASIAIP